MAFAFVQPEPDPIVNQHPAWSPDGNRVVFHSERTGRDQIYVMKADGTQVTCLTCGGG